jgi:hypothetical protein
MWIYKGFAHIQAMAKCKSDQERFEYDTICCDLGFETSLGCDKKGGQEQN